MKRSQVLAKIDWDNIHCPLCGEKRKNTKTTKVRYDPLLSDKKKGKMVFMCTNHPPNDWIQFVIQVFEVNDVIVSVRSYVFQDRLPK